jgi:cyanophycinase
MLPDSGDAHLAIAARATPRNAPDRASLPGPRASLRSKRATRSGEASATSTGPGCIRLVRFRRRTVSAAIGGVVAGVGGAVFDAALGTNGIGDGDGTRDDRPRGLTVAALDPHGGELGRYDLPPVEEDAEAVLLAEAAVAARRWGIPLELWEEDRLLERWPAERWHAALVKREVWLGLRCARAGSPFMCPMRLAGGAVRGSPALLWSVLCLGVVACADGSGADAGSDRDGGLLDAASGDAAIADAGTADAGIADAGAGACGALPSTIAEGRLGSDGDTVAAPTRRVVLMGGGAEVDAASTAMVSAAEGGDVLVLRASGSVDSYTPYFFEELPAATAPASVATLRLDDARASSHATLHCRVDRAEAVWLAGGDQHDYLGDWDESLQARLAATAARGAAVGGTSAGAMVLGELAFDAAHGSIGSEDALTDPQGMRVSVIPSPMAQPELARTIVDTHFSARDREGRMLAFLARARGTASDGFGVGLDERAALVIERGTYRVRSGRSGRAVWLYRFAGGSTLEVGRPLSMDGVRRLRLLDGATGPWPPTAEDFATGVLLAVREGVVLTL